MHRPLSRLFSFAVVLLSAALSAGAVEKAATPPAVVLITVDALRADRLGCFGYERPTSPVVDELLNRGARFAQAWTVEPLTNPALSSLLTSLPPHEHGASRNGLRMRADLPSLPLTLAAAGWDTAAFVSNWTLKHKISRLGDHFDHFEGVFTRKRWFGMFNREATAADVSDETLEWLERHHAERPDAPYFLWVHYVEPHAPYRFQERAAAALGIRKGTATKSDRYDTEVRTVDREIGRVLDALAAHHPHQQPLIAFSADHGESLGEHAYWGHGRNLFDPSLRIPMGLVWPGHIAATTVEAPALITDLAPTILELAGLPRPEGFHGLSWAGLLLGGPAPAPRVLCVEAHKGAVQMKHDSDRARSKGLLQVGVIHDWHKEILELRRGHQHLVFDLRQDPGELVDLAAQGSDPSPELMSCFGEVTTGLGNLDHMATSRLDEESMEQLRALGYLE